ncbi:dipeptidyl aminopeptidase/acylaminoacyl peptidase [Mycolicibacterium iranicum]|uniref:Dipeptidyl aminopeptidase/acylaminoacyl peptidase n=1 Tax=Mycolicibacterium iranicum TaxID=912594 RepID=A0A839QGE0_MYCIR|nr:S9 family peptidase [Mycolicibacterium iranicum]MBB2993794.1 dipeptidyl aminopeptidase/acylaminoacyl peptidase [Mycolicibacterium iranicum]
MSLPDIVSVEDLFDSPVRAAATISPDGTRIAYLAPWKNRLNIWVHGVESDADARCITADETRSVFHYQWTDDPRYLLYLQDTAGDENWHTFRVDLDDPEAPAVDLTPFPGRIATFELLGGKPGKALVYSNKRTIELMDVYELDIATGELTLLAENPGKVASWLSGRHGELFAIGLTPVGDVELMRWESDTATLRTIVVYDGADYTLGLYPTVVTPDGTGIWVGSNEGTDRMRLVRLDAATGKQTAVDSHPTFDIDVRAQVAGGFALPLIQDGRTGELLGVRYLGARQVIRPLNDRFAEILAALQTLSDGDISALSSDRDGRRWVVSFNHDRQPGLTYLYDHDTGQSRLLFAPLPHLDPDVLAPKTPVTIQSRDGLDLHGYLTLPVGVEPTALPLVLVVHGGPWTRDAWGFDPGVQLLANRGYAVLQVNFRGSTGYGKAFTKAGVGEFAAAMHDDLIDSVQWAVQQGYADPDRIAIFGGSYGGYAALVGVTFTPDVFAAAIDYVGISSLANFLRTLPAIARPHLANNWHRFVGNPDIPEQEADMLARSPITKVDEIRTPLLVIQGANDVRVVKAESDNLVDALRARGVEVEYMVKEDEGHGFVNPDNVIELYHAVDRFLADHLGGRRGSAGGS